METLFCQKMGLEAGTVTRLAEGWASTLRQSTKLSPAQESGAGQRLQGLEVRVCQTHGQGSQTQGENLGLCFCVKFLQPNLFQ